MFANACERGKDCVFFGPSIANAITDYLTGKSTLSSPIRNGQGSSQYRDEPIVSFVAALFGHGGPVTVSRLIPFCVVDALDRMFERGFRPHVGNESPEVISPALANCDASPTIAGKVFISFIMASLNHPLVCEVKRMFASAIMRYSAAKRIAMSPQTNVVCVAQVALADGLAAGLDAADIRNSHFNTHTIGLVRGSKVFARLRSPILSYAPR